MKLTRLPRLARIPQVRRQSLRLPGLPRPAPALQEPLIPPGSGFNSRWEVWMDRFLKSRDGRWVSQVQFGVVGFRGATRPDWVLEEKRWAFYLDTPIHVFRGLRPRDVKLRDELRVMGYTVFEWFVPTYEYMVKNARNWYRSEIEGRGTL